VFGALHVLRDGGGGGGGGGGWGGGGGGEGGGGEECEGVSRKWDRSVKGSVGCGAGV